MFRAMASARCAQRRQRRRCGSGSPRRSASRRSASFGCSGEGKPCSIEDLHCLPDAAGCPEEMGLHRPDTDAKKRGDLGERPILVVAEREDIALHVGQGPDLLGDLPADLAADASRLRVRCEVDRLVELIRNPTARGRYVEIEGRFHHSSPCSFEPVATLVDDDPGEPGIERAFLPEPPQASPRLDESVLCGTVGIVSLAQNAVRQPGDRPLVKLDEAPEGLPIPRAGGAHEVCRLRGPLGRPGGFVGGRHSEVTPRLDDRRGGENEPGGGGGAGRPPPPSPQPTPAPPPPPRPPHPPPRAAPPPPGP